MIPNIRFIYRIWLLSLALTLVCRAGIVTNGGFESGLAGWRPLWTREANAGSLSLDTNTVHSGEHSARIEHRGQKDWSLEPALRVPVQAGDIFELEAWLKLVSRGGRVTLCVSTHDAQGKAHQLVLRRRIAGGHGGLAARAHAVHRAAGRGGDSAALDGLRSGHRVGGRFFI